MMRLLAIAFRNLARAKRRNGLSGGTMALGSAALVLGSGLSDGIARQLTDNLVAVQTGHVVLLVRPDDFIPQNSPFDAYGQDLIPGAEEMARRIEAEGAGAGVVMAVPYLHGRATAMAGSRSSPGAVIGIQPSREPELRAAFPPIAGRFLTDGDDLAAYVAEPVARKLRLGVGDAVSFVVQTPKGGLNSMDAVVCGVFKKNAPWYDATFYVTLPAAQGLFDGAGAGTNIKVQLRDGSAKGARRARDTVARIAGAPNGLPAGSRLRVETFDEAGRFSFSIIQANEAALTILSSFLFLAAGVGIVNAMLMSVHERTREIGTMRAMGMRRGLVVRLFLLEGFALGVCAAVAGAALGGAMVLHLARQGIPMNTMTLAWMAGGDALFPVLRPWSVGRAAGAIALLSTLAAAYPAFAASRLEPREALQHV
jgi:putative ABC transport system permease protein